MSASFCLPHPDAVSAFMICRGLCACTEMLWMYVLYVSFGSKVRPRTFGCVAMGSAFIHFIRDPQHFVFRRVLKNGIAVLYLMCNLCISYDHSGLAVLQSRR